MAWHICPQDIFVRICRAVGSGIMTGNKIITVHSIRRGRRTHQAKRKAPKQSDDYHDGYIKHADVQPNLPVFFKRAGLAVFVFYALLNIAERRLTPLCKSYNFPQRCKFMKLFFECYNELVILGATINLGRRCNGCDG